MDITSYLKQLLKGFLHLRFGRRFSHTVRLAVWYLTFSVWTVLTAGTAGAGDISAAVRTTPTVSKRLTVGAFGHMGLAPNVTPFLASYGGRGWAWGYNMRPWIDEMTTWCSRTQPPPGGRKNKYFIMAEDHYIYNVTKRLFSIGIVDSIQFVLAEWHKQLK